MSISVAAVRDELGVRPGRLLVDGKWLDWDGETFEQLHPASNEVMTSFPVAGQRGVDLAVAAARKAFDDGPWPRMPAQDGMRVLKPEM
jgi:aldehyde dehydrogenase (NAD+)